MLALTTYVRAELFRFATNIWENPSVINHFNSLTQWLPTLQLLLSLVLTSYRMSLVRSVQLIEMIHTYIATYLAILYKFKLTNIEKLHS